MNQQRLKRRLCQYCPGTTTRQNQRRKFLRNILKDENMRKGRDICRNDVQQQDRIKEENS
jgi:hypothetical protein